MIDYGVGRQIGKPPDCGSGDCGVGSRPSPHLITLKDSNSYELLFSKFIKVFLLSLNNYIY